MAPSDINPTKRRSACDNCRERKLKCSGGVLCSRCAEDNIKCTYSVQKRMGRPRKKLKAGSDAEITRTCPKDNTPLAVPEWSFDQTPVLSSLNEFAMQNDLLQSDFGGHDMPDISEFLSSHFPETSSSTIPAPLSLENSIDFEPPEQTQNIDPAITTIETSRPSSTSIPHIPMLPCACLSISYVTLSRLQGLTSFTFPHVLEELRAGFTAANDILECEQCPKEFLTSMQNTSLLQTLLSVLAERFHRVLQAIDGETEMLSQTHGTKRFQLGDLTPASSSSDPSASALSAISVELDAQEWRSLARKVIVSEIVYSSSGNNSLIGLVERMEKRQIHWHQTLAPANLCRTEMEFVPKSQLPTKPEDYNCLKMLQSVRGMVDRMGLVQPVKKKS